jgi:hypothetical protein
MVPYFVAQDAVREVTVKGSFLGDPKLFIARDNPLFRHITLLRVTNDGLEFTLGCVVDLKENCVKLENLHIAVHCTAFGVRALQTL